MQSSDENTDIIKKALYIFGVKIQLVCLWKACLGLVMLMMRKGGGRWKMTLIYQLFTNTEPHFPSDKGLSIT